MHTKIIFAHADDKLAADEESKAKDAMDKAGMRIAGDGPQASAARAAVATWQASKNSSRRNSKSPTTRDDTASTGNNGLNTVLESIGSSTQAKAKAIEDKTLLRREKQEHELAEQSKDNDLMRRERELQLRKAEREEKAATAAMAAPINDLNKLAERTTRLTKLADKLRPDSASNPQVKAKLERVQEELARCAELELQALMADG